MIYPFEGPLVRPKEKSAYVEEQPRDGEKGREGEEEQEQKASYEEEDGFEEDASSRVLARLGRAPSRAGRRPAPGVSLLAVRAKKGQR